MRNKFFIYSTIISTSIILFTGCAKNAEVVKQKQLSDIEKNIDYRINEFDKRYYQQNFKTIEIADSEREIGIQSINKSNYQTYNKEKIIKDDLDIKPKTKIKVIQRSDIRIEKNSIGEVQKNKVTQIEKVQVLSKNNIHDGIDYKNKYSKSYPFIFGINNSIFKRDLKTNKEYVMAIDSKQRIGIYEQMEKCNNKIIKNSNVSCYLDIKNYKYSPNFKSHITIHFKFDGEKIKIFNQKFDVNNKVGEKFEIALTNNKKLYFKINK